MTLSYYPGCTLKDRAKELDRSARLAAAALGFELKELDSWQCCGAVYPQVNDEIGARLPAIRALMAAENGTLVTVCTACHNVLKRANADWQRDADFRARASQYLDTDTPYDGGTRVIHLMELIRDEVGFDKLAQMVKNPLTGRRIGAFYGCLSLRPGEDMTFDDPENPHVFESFITALGAQSIVYPLRTECCGAYLPLSDERSAADMASAAVRSAMDAGCDALVTACPLCRFNLTKTAGNTDLPVYYFTSLLAEALGVEGQ